MNSIFEPSVYPNLLDLSAESAEERRQRLLAYHGGELGFAAHQLALAATRAGLRVERQPRRRTNPDTLALTLASAARRLGIAKENLRRLIDEGRIWTVKWPGRTAGVVGPAGRVRIPLAEVERIALEGFAPAPKAKAALPKPRPAGGRIRDLPY